MNEQIKDRPSALLALIMWDRAVRAFRMSGGPGFYDEGLWQYPSYQWFLFYMVQAYGPRVGGYASPYCVGKGD